VTLRVVGGWVRDKLLGKTSSDIDVALDTLPGRAFAEHVNAYLASVGQSVRGVGVIAANPEQSKHLETATM
jgi:tRNA nucleotidyltransferase (CCA-adding enzyme)